MLSDEQQRRLEEKKLFEQLYELKRKQIAELQKSHTIETDPSRKFQYEEQIKEAEKELKKFEDKLNEIEKIDKQPIPRKVQNFELENLGLWQKLENEEQRSVVIRLVNYATEILDQNIIETLPAYTLHNSGHAIKVVKFIDQLLGSDNLNKLTSLEAAMLILSAFWHDIGMVFNYADMDDLKHEQSWNDFLKENPEANLSWVSQENTQTKTVTKDLAETYCNWTHAKRVDIYILKYLTESSYSFDWEGLTFQDGFFELCCSHDIDVAKIKTLDGNYLNEADLRFCAVLLRLADILDFDNSRSPIQVYQRLGIERRTEPRRHDQDVEWRDFLQSKGFEIPEQREANEYELKITASPKDPAVEFDFREFLDNIEDQIEQCRSILKGCERWQDFILPKRINRSKIQSQGYVYGEYRFSLDQKQVLELLMGENLYQERYVFVRELLQNAIDTSRYREYYEQLNGYTNFKAEPISITQWKDREGRLWIRFDDYGMGMNKSIIEEYFLKIGSSFYQTAKFKAEVIEAYSKGSPNFTPISRFGIGILSCFIIGDKVEVSTNHRNSKNENERIRLSLNGLHRFYILQTGMMKANAMPSDNGESNGYRKEFGTSIAVRIDPRKQEQATLNLRSLIENHIFSSPIPIKLKTSSEPEYKSIGYDYQTVIETPWCERQSIELSSAEMEQLNELTNYNFPKPLSIEFIPIDLTKNTSTPEFKGQLLTAIIRPTKEWAEFVEIFNLLDKDLSLKCNISLKYYRNHTDLSFEEYYPKPVGQYFLTFTIGTGLNRYCEFDRDSLVSRARQILSNHTIENTSVSQAVDFVIRSIESSEKLTSKSQIKSFSKFYEPKNGIPDYPYQFTAFCRICIDRIFDNLPEHTRNIIINASKNSSKQVSHNGIVIPPKSYFSKFDRDTTIIYPLNPKIKLNDQFSSTRLSWGTISLADSLRPNVDISRGALLTVPLAVYSEAILSLYRSLKDVGLERFTEDYSIYDFTRIINKYPPTIQDIEKETDILKNSEWRELSLIETFSGKLSINQIFKCLERREEIILRYLPNGSVNNFAWLGYDRSFHRFCVSALVENQLNLQVKIHDSKPEIHVIPGYKINISEGQKLFPPFTFLPYVDTIFLAEGCGVNINHPLSRWIIDKTPRLAEAYPGMFGQLKLQLVEIPFGDIIYSQEDRFLREDFSPSTVQEKINNLLEDIRALNDQEFNPDESLLLKDSDFLHNEDIIED